MFYQGKYEVKNKLKYIGNKNQIFFRSNYEKRFFMFLDEEPDILKWNSEEAVIPYLSIDNKFHKYFIDIFIQTKKGKFLIEIKPFKQTKPPSKKSKYYLKEERTFIINQLKWESAKKHAKKNGITFLVLTEKEIDPKFTNKKIKDNLKRITII